MPELKTLVDEVLSNNKSDFFTQKEIQNRIEKIKKEKDGDNSYSYKSLQSTVSRRLKELQKNGVVIKIGKTYAYKTTQNIHYIIKDDICSKVTFFKDKVFIISPNVVAVPVNGTAVNIAKELFNEYYGEEGFYGALYIDEYLLLMLNTEAIDMDIKQIAEDIEEIIKSSKQFEHNRQEIRLQMQHTRIIKDIIKYAKLSSENESASTNEVDCTYKADETDETNEMDRFYKVVDDELEKYK